MEFAILITKWTKFISTFDYEKENLGLDLDPDLVSSTVFRIRDVFIRTRDLYY